jgi:sugar/nucleoside kinase (ribokinase family)
VHFLAVGDLMIDLTVSGHDHDASIELRAGGSALNSARAAAAKGAKATVAGRVGDDLAGRALAGFLAGAGIGAELAVDPAVRTGTFAIVDGAVRVDRGANAGDWAPATLPAADVALVSGYLSPATVSEVVGRLDAAIVAVSAGLLREIPAGVDVVLANADEARELPACSARVVCVTLGAEGAVVTTPDGVVRARPSQVYEGDPLGAGDAFAAWFLLALAEGAPVEKALEAAQSPSPGLAM